jgi:hypothetical protein
MTASANQDGIEIGTPRERLRSEEGAIASARAMLVVIGPQWLASGRLDDPGDWVRREIAAALAAERVMVAPVLHDGAAEPRREQLPDDRRDRRPPGAGAVGMRSEAVDTRAVEVDPVVSQRRTTRVRSA